MRVDVACSFAEAATGRRRMGSRLTRATLGAMAGFWLTMGCVTEPPIAKPPSDPGEEAVALSTPACSVPPCAGSERARATKSVPTPPLPPYEPEVIETSSAMTTAEAVRLLGALDAPGDPKCSKWRKPLAQSCEAGEADVVEVVANIQEGQADKNGVAESETLFHLEGCDAFPKGALRWLRIRYLGQCGVELAEPVLATGGPDLVPTVRGLLVGEVIAETCRRNVAPMARYRGEYSPEAFEGWRRSVLVPWHETTLKGLDACHEVAASLPAGAPGRAVALIGYAQAVAKFVMAHRGSPIDKAISNNHEMRTAYLAALDAITVQFNERRNAASEEVQREAAHEGDYEGYARSLDLVLVRREVFGVLGLPQLPRLLSETNERLLTRLPVQVSLMSAAYEPLESVGYGAFEAWLSALLRRGLPQVIRAQLGREIATMSVHDAERQRLHGLLAAGLVRLGLVTQDRTVLERATYELQYAEPNVATSWLGAVTRALLTPGKEKAILPWFGHMPAHSKQGTADLSGFTPELLNLAAPDPLYASLAIDHALLRSLGTWPSYTGFKRDDEGLELGRRPGVPTPQRRCVNQLVALCGWPSDDWDIREGLQRPCSCISFPWRVEDREH
jgi:hypothetical protein